MKIIVTTDFSSSSKSGIRFALQLASQTKCELTFYNVFEGVENNSWNTKATAKKETFKVGAKNEKLRKFIAEVCEENNTPVGKFKYVVETGIEVKTFIINYAKKNKADYVCIGTRGGGLLKKIIGTITSELIQELPASLIVVPKTYRKKKIAEIGYCSDLSNLKKEMVVVENFAKLFKSDIQVFNYDYLIEVDEEKKRLNKIVEKYRKTGINFYFKKLKIDDSLALHLQEDIDRYKASVVVLFTYKNKAWYDKLFLRNNSTEIAFATKAPLLIVKK